MEPPAHGATWSSDRKGIARRMPSYASGLPIWRGKMRLCGRGQSSWKPLCKELLLPKQAPNRARASVNRSGVREPRPYLLSIQLTAPPYNTNSGQRVSECRRVE